MEWTGPRALRVCFNPSALRVRVEEAELPLPKKVGLDEGGEGRSGWRKGNSFDRGADGRMRDGRGQDFVGVVSQRESAQEGATARFTA